ncbi:MAG: SMP-30/gluconolactonase/LRE family protein [Acidobacteriota bacterium]
MALLILPAVAHAQDLFEDDFESAGPCAWSRAQGVALSYEESFDGSDGDPWPAPWTAAGSVALADLSGAQARFRPTPSGYSLARLVAPVDTLDVEVRATLIFEDIATQGIGFYVRQNGGYLDDTVPPGEGYAVFVEGFRATQGIGVWREVDGHEQPVQIHFDNGLGLQNGVPYRVRFRATQLDAATTQLQAKIWPLGQSEPAAWTVSVTDSTPELQNLSGGIALDSWSSIQSPNPITAHTLVDDLEIEALCNPVASFGPVTTIAETFQFTEGPLWVGDHLLFSDIQGDTIYRLDPPDGISVFRTPSGEANGLALSPSDELLAAEHGTRRISRADNAGTVHTLVETYTGLRFNSPNDLTLRSDGTLYFTDPSYGLAAPGDRELPFNGLFHREPDGTLHASWQGVPGSNEPNGVALTSDQQRLFVTDSQAGELLVFDIAPDGSPTNRRPVASGMTIPDGLCLDSRGNLYVATWASTLEVFAPSGAYWGSIPIPRQATNCAFDPSGAIYVTAQEGIYRVERATQGAE